MESQNAKTDSMEIQNDLFIRTVRGEVVERPPVWLMRQAGRTLPGYRKIRKSVSGFKELVKTPELVVQATVEPIELLGVDAAILFSDILVIPEAMGLEYELIEKKGPLFPKTIQTQEDVTVLQAGDVAAEKLDYVYESITQTKAYLDNQVPLLGFAGAPWTIFAYMVEGSGSKTFSKAKALLYKAPDLSHQLLQKITTTTIAYLKRKIVRGVNLVQIFDSWAGILTPEHYQIFALPYIKQICEAVSEAPITVFAKNAWFAMEAIGELDCEVIGVDWNTNPQKAREWVGDQKILQGNLDPCQLFASTTEVEKATQQMIRAFENKHIANLGHGVYPDTPFDSIKCFVNTVKGFQY